MKNILPLLILAVSIISCNKKEDVRTVIAGQLENIEADSIYIMNDDYRKAIPVKDYTFSDTITVSNSAYFTLRMGNESTQIFLNPSDSLHVTVNGEEFDESLKYSGNSAEENNFLAADYLAEESAMANPEAIFSLEPIEYKKKMTELKEASNQKLEASKASAEFKGFQKKNNEARYLTMLIQYPQAYQYFAGQEVKLPADFTQEFETFDFENEEDFARIPNYKDLVLMRLSELVGDLESKEDRDKMVATIKSQKIKDQFLKGMVYEISSTNTESEEVHDLIVKHGKDDKIVQQAKDKFKTIQSILPGKPSPQFDYPDINGKNVKLDDLKGNLVYVDVWATWCGPCIKEIPSLKQLEADYHGKTVQVVSISIDVEKDFGKWENMVKEKDLKGIQLFADNNWKSDFVKSYAIDGIPRFILIDKEGNIINSDAPRPSDPQIRELLNAHL